MFKIRRPAIIGLLLVLLVFTGYLNYQLTQQALLGASREYQNHEMAEMETYQDMAVNDDIQIVDSLLSDDRKEDVAQVISAGNLGIEGLESQVKTNDRNYFVEYRLSRDKLRANTVDRLNEIVKNSQTTDEVRSNAQQEIIKIGSNSEKELHIEGLVKSKGFDEALVFITDSDIKVVVSADAFSEQDMVKILDIVKSETDFGIDKIKIMEKK